MDTAKQIPSKKLKNALLVFFMALFFLPMLQQLTGWIKEPKLLGVENTATVPEFSFDAWFEGNYQKEFEPALDINTGFRKTLVHSFSQLKYWLFNVSTADVVVVGKNNYLYIGSYIDAVNGNDFVGKNYIDIEMSKAKIIQQELKKKNKDFVFVLAPGKGSFYPEFIPDAFLKNVNADSTNYVCYKNAMNQKGLNLLDLRSYFLAIKDTAKNKLFPTAGVHWSEYASIVAIDTISKYIEATRKIKLRPFHISKFEERKGVKWHDFDAGALMNLYTEYPHPELPCVDIAYAPDTGYAKPNVLFVGDSYYSIIEAYHIPDSIYSKSSYWLYERRPSSISGQEFNFWQEMEQRDVIFVIGTDASLGKFPYNFIDQAYEVYAPKDQAYADLKNREFRYTIAHILTTIKNDKKWKRQLMKSAKERQIPFLDECIGNAVWLYKMQDERNKQYLLK